MILILEPSYCIWMFFIYLNDWNEMKKVYFKSSKKAENNTNQNSLCKKYQQTIFWNMNKELLTYIMYKK